MAGRKSNKPDNGIPNVPASYPDRKVSITNTRAKYDNICKSYTAEDWAKAKQRAKALYIEEKGLVSVKRLARAGKVPQRYVRSWINKEKWKRYVLEDPDDKVALSVHTKEVLKSTAEDMGLEQDEELFCYHYMKTFNATNAAVAAGVSPNISYQWAYQKLKEPHIHAYLSYVKQQRNQELFIDAMRVLDEYVKIAFADMTDYVTFGSSGVSLKPSTKVDGQLITKIREGKDGVTIELADKMKALDMLAKHLKILDNGNNTDKNPFLAAAKLRMKERIGKDNV